MKRILSSLGMCLILSGMSFGQTTLSAGDVVLSTINSDGNKNFSFVLLSSIESGTELKFTDDAWYPVGDSLRGSEGTITWTATSAMPKGTEIQITESSSTTNIASNYGSVSRSGSFTLAVSGDQIHIYQGTEASPTFIFSFNYDATGFVLTDNDNAGDTGLPSGLTENTNAISLSPHRDNWQYNCPSLSDGSASNILSSYMSSSNYNSDDATEYSPIGCNYRDVTISGSAGWRLLSIPRTGATGADISDDGIGAQFTTNTDSATIYTYDDTGAFEAVFSDASTLTDGHGLAVYFFDNTTNGSSELPLSLDVSGTEPSSDVTINLNTSNTAGTSAGSGASNSYYTLAGNPFASNYNLNSITVDAGSVQDNAFFWNDGSSTYSLGDFGSGSYIVAPWQGFWFERANAGTTTQVTFPSSGKTTSSASGFFFSKVSANKGNINFTLSSENSLDEAIKLAFREYAILGFDRADASKMIPLTNAYAIMAFKDEEGKLKSVESLPWNLSEEVKLDLELTQVQVSGGFTFSWKGMETIPSDYEITFHDYEAGTSVNMRSESSFIFDSQAPASKTVTPLSILNGLAAVEQKSKSAGTRFGITITPNTTSVNNEEEGRVEKFALSQNYPNPFNPTTTINYSVENAGPVTISIYNLMGQKIAELVNESKAAGSYNVTWNAANAASGMYYYRLEAAGQTLTRKMTLIK